MLSRASTASGRKTFVDTSTTFGLPTATQSCSCVAAALVIVQNIPSRLLVCCSPAGGVMLLQYHNDQPWTTTVGNLSFSGAAFGDVDLDGDEDLLLTGNTSQLWMNNGTGFTLGYSWSRSGAAVLVDADGDGVLDVPSLDVLAPARVVGVAWYVRVVGRNNLMNQCGATVCLSTVGGSSMSMCRGVCSSSGSGGSGQGPYDAHFGASGSSGAGNYTVWVWFVSGASAGQSRVFAGQTFQAPGSTLVVRDTPVLSSVAIFPASGWLHVGDVVVVVMTAFGGEVGLAPCPAACCIVNDVNVSSTFVDYGNGSYSVTYVARVGDPDSFQHIPSLVR